MTKWTKLLISLGVFAVMIAVANSALASDAEALQPASSADRPASATKVGDVGRYIDEYSSYMQLSTALHSSETMHLPDVHIGSTDANAGGVTYFNGTIRNIALDENGGDTIPVTFGDDLRIDGAIWRGTSKGTADDMPVKIADSVVPALTNTNDFGSTSFLWQDGFFNGTVWMTKLGGENVVTEENLSATNAATIGYVLTAADNSRFTWVANSDNDTVASLSCSNNQIAKWNGTAWACAADENDVSVTYQSATSGGLAIPSTNPTASTIVTGRVRVTANEGYAVTNTVTLSSGFTSANTYTVTATYEYDNGPDLDIEQTPNPIVVNKTDGSNFIIYTHLASDVQGTAPLVSWQAIGY
ncbi:MAG: hypothetical protein HQ530_00070 [Parcubacteria group bacterium]|nr:hypothetical protein [Parcubacteria group bacterium]